MRLGLTPDEEFFQDNIRKFLDASVTPAQLRQWSTLPAGHPPEWWRQGAELGWTSPLVSEKSGGGTVSGAPLADLSVIAHQCGRHAAPGPLIATNVAAYCLDQLGPGSTGARLPALLSGEATAAWVRVGTGDLGEAAVTAVVEGEHLVLNGVAEAVEGAADAEWLVVSTDDSVALLSLGGPHSDAVGTVRVSRREGIDLNRRWAQVGFDRTRVPLIGSAAGIGRRLLDLALCLQQSESVGAMEVAFSMTMEWVKNRYSFGRPLGSYQELKHRLADMRLWLDASAAITVAAIDAWDQDGADASELASAAKAYVGRHGPELVQDCVQIHGGIGVTFDHDLHLYLRRVAAGAPALGTPSQHQRRLAGIIARRAAA